VDIQVSPGGNHYDLFSLTVETIVLSDEMKIAITVYALQEQFSK
jgi:hypothetical protein